MKALRFALGLLLALFAHHSTFAQAGKLIWKQKYPSQGNWSSPVIAGDYVLVQGQDKGLYCYAASTGALVWMDTVNFGGQVHHPKIHNGYMYTTSGGTGFCKVNPANGNILWRRTDLMYNLSHATPIGNGRAFLVYESQIYCLNTSNGNTIWKKDLSAQSLVLHPNGEELLVSPFRQAKIIALHVSDASIKWEIKLNDTTAWPGVMAIKDSSLLVVCSDMTYTPGNQKFYGLNLISKTVTWEASGMGYSGDYAPPAIWGNTVVVSTRPNMGPEPQRIRALNINTGQQIWQRPARYASANRSVIPIALDGKVFYENGEDTSAQFGFVCADILNGNVLWVATDSSKSLFTRGSLLVANNKLYGNAETNVLYCFDAGAVNGLWPMYSANSYATCQAGFSPSTGISKNLVQISEIQLYPNPSQGELNLQGISNEASMEVYNLKGECVAKVSVENNAGVLNLSELPAAVYGVMIKEENAQPRFLKWVKW